MWTKLFADIIHYRYTPLDKNCVETLNFQVNCSWKTNNSKGPTFKILVLLLWLNYSILKSYSRQCEAQLYCTFMYKFVIPGTWICFSTSSLLFNFFRFVFIWKILISTLSFRTRIFSYLSKGRPLTRMIGQLRVIKYFYDLVYFILPIVCKMLRGFIYFHLSVRSDEWLFQGNKIPAYLCHFLSSWSWLNRICPND